MADANDAPDTSPEAPLNGDLERLRGAARDVIQATRGLLDAVEEVLADDDRVRGVADGVTEAFRTVSEAVRGIARPSTPPAAPPEDRVERIVVE